jgi:hypothetical protein
MFGYEPIYDIKKLRSLCIRKFQKTTRLFWAWPWTYIHMTMDKIALFEIWTMYRNLMIFQRFWSNSGYWKSQKALDFLALFIFNRAFWLYIASQKIGWFRRKKDREREISSRKRRACDQTKRTCRARERRSALWAVRRARPKSIN